MTDRTDPKKPSIPAWQQTPDDSSNTSSNAPRGTEGPVPVEDCDAVLEQAKIFLKDESVRDAPRERKLAFLGKKGLQGDEIQKLLDTEPPPSSGLEDDVKTIDDSSTPRPSSLTASNSPSISSSSHQTTPTPRPDRDIPPIITYPEFLLRPTKPPPLITLERLSYTLYTLAGVSALTYGASKYLIHPMLASLTSSRHDLASTAIHNLQKLNEKLQGTVSHIPAIPSSTLLQQREQGPNAHDDTSSSIASDPTELFHRDVATQTSPHLPTRSASITSSSTTSSSSSSHPHQTTDTTTHQTTRLTTLSHALTTLLTTESTPSTPLLDALASTHSYLDNLQFHTTTTTTTASYPDHHILHPGISSKDATTRGRSAGTGTGTGKGRGREAEEREDEAARFRQEIRSVKGALLSGRNFPVGRPATLDGGAGTGTGTGIGVRQER